MQQDGFVLRSECFCVSNDFSSSALTLSLTCWAESCARGRSLVETQRWTCERIRGKGRPRWKSYCYRVDLPKTLQTPPSGVQLASFPAVHRNSNSVFRSDRRGLPLAMFGCTSLRREIIFSHVADRAHQIGLSVD